MMTGHLCAAAVLIKVFTDADELGSLRERVAELGVTADMVQRVPGVGEPIFVGLS
ncbi:MAG: hypothetical protein QNM02_11635 [Acidimicrobiia bacterium]|nr:hypothetical protein [Acidimicrobiia bacterium]